MQIILEDVDELKKQFLFYEGKVSDLKKEMASLYEERDAIKSGNNEILKIKKTEIDRKLYEIDDFKLLINKNFNEAILKRQEAEDLLKKSEESFKKFLSYKFLKEENFKNIESELLNKRIQLEREKSDFLNHVKKFEVEEKEFESLKKDVLLKEKQCDDISKECVIICNKFNLKIEQLNKLKASVEAIRKANSILFDKLNNEVSNLEKEKNIFEAERENLKRRNAEITKDKIEVEKSFKEIKLKEIEIVGKIEFLRKRERDVDSKQTRLDEIQKIIDKQILKEKDDEKKTI